MKMKQSRNKKKQQYIVKEIYCHLDYVFFYQHNKERSKVTKCCLNIPEKCSLSTYFTSFSQKYPPARLCLLFLCLCLCKSKERYFLPEYCQQPANLVQALVGRFCCLWTEQVQLSPPVPTLYAKLSYLAGGGSLILSVQTCEIH